MTSFLFWNIGQRDVRPLLGRAVQTPLAILRVQARLLSQLTSGILDGDVETEETDKLVQHRLVVIAPAYNGYKHTLVTVIHNPDIAYPAEVRVPAIEEIERISDLLTRTTYPKATSDVAVQQLAQKSLQSGETEAIILSLIAKSNEYRKTPVLENV